MPDAVTLEINGQKQHLTAANVAELLQQMDLKTDRVAVERNGEIVSRTRWTETQLAEGDRLEIVHFVGGGRL
jgi:thiamine biosynthesis protein ThiS